MLDRFRAQYAKNAAQLATMRDKATATGHKVNGYTAAELVERAALYEHLAQATDEELAAHIQTLARRVAR